MIGATITRTGTPAAVSSRMARNLAGGELVRGSRQRAKSASSVVTEMLTAHKFLAPWGASRSRSRTTTRIFRDDAERLLRLGHYLNAAACDLQSPFGRLVAIGHSRHGNHFAAPARFAQLGPQQRRGIGLVKHLGLEIQAGVQTQRFVPRPGITVSAAVLATPIWIDAVAKWNIRTVVGSDDAAAGIGKKLRRLAALTRLGLQFEIELLPIRLAAHPFKTIGGRNLRSAADDVRWG